MSLLEYMEAYRKVLENGGKFAESQCLVCRFKKNDKYL
jgi:hypothetical protein